MKRATLYLLLAGLALLAAGLALGDAQRVLVNATLLCLSCIGVG